MLLDFPGSQHCAGRGIDAVPNGIQVEPGINSRCVLILVVQAFPNDRQTGALLGLPASQVWCKS